MSVMKVRRIELAASNAATQIKKLRDQFRIDTEIVSAASKKLTTAVFGKPMNPTEAVAHICLDVRDHGLEAVLKYTECFDKVKLKPNMIRVEQGELDVELPVLSGGSEAAQLSTALGGMMKRLVRANLELEQRVAERTAELELANAELDRQARTDPLTGLLNRRGMEERFRPALLSARRRQAALSVLLVDIDHFKRVNDTHGHDAGDQALCTLAQAMTLRLRESDIVARHGGEEFVVILPDTDARQARVVADELVASISQLPLAIVGAITISCGVSQVRLANDTVDSVLQRADEALYRAKNEGRNRTSFADTSLELALDLIPD